MEPVDDVCACNIVARRLNRRAEAIHAQYSAVMGV